jgi:hypothetical protein
MEKPFAEFQYYNRKIHGQREKEPCFSQAPAGNGSQESRKR